MRRFSIFAALLLTALLVSIPALSQDIISTAIGGGPNGIPAIDAALYNPYGTAVDGAGNVYIAVWNAHRVFKVTTSTGIITVVAGNGAQGYAGDGVTGGAASASLYHPYAVAVDWGDGSASESYFQDNAGPLAARTHTYASEGSYTPRVTITDFVNRVGSTSFQVLVGSISVALDGSGNLVVADNRNNRVEKFRQR